MSSAGHSTVRRRHVVATRTTHGQGYDPRRLSGRDYYGPGQAALEQVGGDALAEGSVSGPSIQREALDVAKFASTIRPVQIVDALPTLPDDDYPPDAAVVLLTTDGKLYRNVGDTWTAEVDVDDLDGMVPGAVDVVAVLPTLPDAAYPQGAIVFLTTDEKLYRNADGSTWSAEVLAADVAGLAAAAVESVAVLPTLPDADYAAGRIVFLTTDGKLYRNTDGSTWTAELAAVDITGQVTETQITDDAITTAKIAADAITANEIAANAVTATQIAANAVTANKILAGAVEAGKIAADAVTANEIAANAVTANELAANAVTADKILAGAVEAGKIAADAVTATEIAAGAIEAGHLSADAVTAGTVAAGAIGADEIAAGSINTSHLEAGNITLVDENGEVALEPAGFGPTWRRFIQSGMYNSDFGIQSPTPASDLGVGNQIPYWPFTVEEGVSIDGRSVVQSGDNAVRFVASDGNAGDKAYIEQIIPLASAEKALQRLSVQFAVGGSGFFSADVVPKLWVDWLDSSGTLIGSADGGLSLTTWIVSTDPNGGFRDLGAFPAGAAFVRVRFGCHRTVGSGDDGILYLHEARFGWAGPPVRYIDSSGDLTTYPTLGWVGMEFGRLALKAEAGGSQSEIRIFNSDGTGGGITYIAKDGENLLSRNSMDPGDMVLKVSGDGVTIAEMTDLSVRLEGLQRGGGTSFPASPSDDDRYFRTDLNLWFRWNGFVWVTVTKYSEQTAEFTASATAFAQGRCAFPFSPWGGDIFIEDVELTFMVIGGTALSGSHKWDVAFHRRNAADAATVVASYAINSGSSSVWRRSSVTAVNTAVAQSSAFVLSVNATKTGTPGNLVCQVKYTYRLAAT